MSRFDVHVRVLTGFLVNWTAPRNRSVWCAWTERQGWPREVCGYLSAGVAFLLPFWAWSFCVYT